jgi:hypothetical protein
MSQPWFVKNLTPREVLLFFLLANFLFVFPLMQADYFYFDDQWRMLTAIGAWGEEGRIAIQLFHNVFSFGSKVPDLFPLPLFIATAGIGVAMRTLTFFYFERPTFVHCLVVLPIWYNPFFLQNLSYRYDGPVMALGLVALIYAMTWSCERKWRNVWIPALLLTVALSIYQVLMSFFIALCCVEIIRRIWERQTYEVILTFVGQKLIVFGIGLLMYYLTAYQLMHGVRQGLLSMEIGSVIEIGNRWFFISQMLNGLATGSVGLMTWVGLLLAAGGYVWGGVSLLARSEKFLHILSLAGLYILALLVLLFCVPGITLFFSIFIFGVRTLVAFSVWLLFVFLFVFYLLSRIDVRLGIVLVVPLLAMMSFSFAYGRVLSLQKEQEAVMLASLAYDISHSSLHDKHNIYMVPEYVANWLPAASGAFAAMPALRKVAEVGYILLPETLPRAGITNVYLAKDQETIASIRRGDYLPVVSTRFYDLFVIHDDGYIFMKRTQDDPDVAPKLCLITGIERCR